MGFDPCASLMMPATDAIGVREDHHLSREGTWGRSWVTQGHSSRGRRPRVTILPPVKVGNSCCSAIKTEFILTIWMNWLGR
ncbi:hypothetical protein Pden_1218 [Paracoccus denitrificans PD1222]|uniref:Uncharacterized protein n=1 Tax=Paracoccus denitrificans (strain Pd 1222) TaxID=318586 RepID=A1B1C9_PARDP|nr:hypothetical protein Pden_1218 [Paracoccus denitrificans PD1222]